MSATKSVGNKNFVISELLKDSQYLTDSIDTNNLTTTVSGALDR